ncbi:MAG TPA: hypothetical protein DC058_07205 [Planctomycetaceae bacterium]|nr:hypothetical protein [Planctomycetaceae bacterium]
MVAEIEADFLVSGQETWVLKDIRQCRSGDRSINEAGRFSGHSGDARGFSASFAVKFVFAVCSGL